MDQKRLEEAVRNLALAIADHGLETVTFIDVLAHSVDDRRDMIKKLVEVQRGTHILESLEIVFDHLRELMSLLRRSHRPEEAHRGLTGRLGFSPRQAASISDMRLPRVTGLERDEILAELAASRAEIAERETMLAADAKRVSSRFLDLVTERPRKEADEGDASDAADAEKQDCRHEAEED